MSDIETWVLLASHYSVYHDGQAFFFFPVSSSEGWNVGITAGAQAITLGRGLEVLC